MKHVRVSTEWSYHGLQVITIENGLLRVQILPAAGAKIWQITYLPLGADLLWNNPRIPVSRHSIHANYDDVWSGGWDELFPNDEEAIIGTERYPDHGELWTGQWDFETFTSEDEAGVILKFQTPVSRVGVQKTISLRKGSSQVHFRHTLQNLGAAPFPFLWKLHPAFRVTPHHRIDFPAMKVVREPAFPGTLADAPCEFPWPHARVGDREIDLRRVPCHDERQLYFVYGTEIQSRWCAITDAAKQLSCGIRFDPTVFNSCWLFASYGGWRNYDVAVLEPCTGYPLNFDAMVAAGRQKILQPLEVLSTDVLFTVQQGISSVSDIREDGVIVP